jgi:hypothetical protein
VIPLSILGLMRANETPAARSSVRDLAVHAEQWGYRCI